MLHRAYTIYDSKVEAYMKPFFAMSDGDALRSFVDAINSPDSPFFRHPDDYTLFQIGVYDDTHAELKSTTAVSLGCAIQFKNGETNGL